ncbi:MAG TPA: ClpXP protease specificity-enhancing factor [Gammaproteobacteria bacterium]|nr:ClpXP protease specificity-enhancing factor [Gammaproteobacteria bacterium]
MTSRKPYLIRAFYDWILDNSCTPFLLVDCGREGVVVPEQNIQDGKIVLNVGPTAVAGLDLGNGLIGFSARFGGVAFQVEIPPQAVLAIYAHENGEGMMFPPEDDGDPPPQSGGDDGGEGARKRPSLRVVK